MCVRYFLLHDQSTTKSLSKSIIFLQLGSNVFLLIPSTSMSYLFISVAICLVLPVFHIVRTFHVAILIVALFVRMDIGLVVFEESRLTL
ncbi:unnamed protein product [Schistosoma mattheei]|uniref:Uncharacterized protein n=1 Tax=Schistosoma mattheei TaxID=31246 RepID=A0A3P8ELM3_9TREM|nr:unnamed protein product [Schistosoma mattheei]